MQLTIPEAAVRRFFADCAALSLPEGPLGVAVSGGPDSLALLLLARSAFPDRVMAATVDHRLRPESADEAALVARLCEQIGIPHVTLPVTVAPGNLQAEARLARYRALGDWAREAGMAAVLTAHHLDDQAETLLLRLMRGAGLGGLAAMRQQAPMPMADDIILARPLLGWRRAELAAIVTEFGWQAVDDPSNRNPRFDRARLRRDMAEATWLDPVAISASAAHLGDAVDAIAWAEQREMTERVVFEGSDGASYRALAPRLIRIGVVRQIIETLGSEGQPRGSELARFVEALEVGGIATLGGVKGDGSDPERWKFTPAPPRRSR